MTDNEIIVPLKCLVMNESDCRHCKLKDKNDKCQKFLYSDVLGLIDENNRQKAEIERLKAELKEDSRTMKQALVLIDEIKKEIAVDIETAKAEAVHEFSYRLRVECGSYDRGHYIFHEDEIDNLVKEMAGEGNV